MKNRSREVSENFTIITISRCFSIVFHRAVHSIDDNAQGVDGSLPLVLHVYSENSRRLHCQH